MLHLFKVGFHVIKSDFLLRHELQLIPINLGFDHVFNIVESSPRFNIGSYFCHGFLDVIEVCLTKHHLVYFATNLVDISLLGQDLFDVLDALVLYFECLVDALEGELDDVLDVSPFRIGLLIQVKVIKDYRYVYLRLVVLI